MCLEVCIIIIVVIVITIIIIIIILFLVNCNRAGMSTLQLKHSKLFIAILLLFKRN
jgi:hypothetical protein